MSLILVLLGIDDWNRPVYQDQNGKLWKNIKHLACDESDVRNNIDGLCAVYGNIFDGEPDTALECFHNKPVVEFSTQRR